MGSPVFFGLLNDSWNEEIETRRPKMRSDVMTCCSTVKCQLVSPSSRFPECSMKHQKRDRRSQWPVIRPSVADPCQRQRTLGTPPARGKPESVPFRCPKLPNSHRDGKVGCTGTTSMSRHQSSRGLHLTCHCAKLVCNEVFSKVSRISLGPKSAKS